MKAIGIVAALSALLTAGNAFAQAGYPDKPLRVLVGFVAGGPADVVARVVGDKLTKAWGKPVVIENVTGSGGNMATERVAKSAPDGYTLLLGTSGPFVIHPSLYPKLLFDPVKDFAPITQLCFTANVLVVNNDVPAKSVAELVALARAQPGKLTFGSAGVGTTQHLSGELFKTMAGLDIQHVPYRGIAAVMPDLLAGRLTMVFSSPVSALPLAREGKGACARGHLPDARAVIARPADYGRSGLPRLRRHCLVRAAGTGRHAGADHCQAPSRGGAHPGAARCSQALRRARHGADGHVARAVRRRDGGGGSALRRGHQGLGSQAGGLRRKVGSARPARQRFLPCSSTGRLSM